MNNLKLRFNGKYHVVAKPDESASSRCDGVTRSVEDAALAVQSGLIFLQTTDQFPSVRSTSRSVRFDEVPARAGALGEVKTVMDVAVARDAAVELRRVRLYEPFFPQPSSTRPASQKSFFHRRQPMRPTLHSANVFLSPRLTIASAQS
jgi:hypothetical protein